MLEKVGELGGGLGGLALISSADSLPQRKFGGVLKIWLKQKSGNIEKGPNSLWQSEETHLEKRNGNMSC